MRKFIKFSKKGKTGLSLKSAPDIKSRIRQLIGGLQLDFLKSSRIFTYRSFNSTSRAYARTWGFPKIWQMSLKENPAYIIEVISERFDKLSDKDQDKVLIHELAHMPKNFSGSLLPHIRRGKRNFHDRVETLFAKYQKSKVS